MDHNQQDPQRDPEQEMDSLARIVKQAADATSQARSLTNNGDGSAPSPEEREDVCPKCSGFGVITYDVSITDPRFGKAFPCPDCQSEGDPRRLHLLRRVSNLHAHQDKTFEQFKADLPYLGESQAQSLRIAQGLCERYAVEPDGWLLLQGRYGCGKTHLAAAIANALVDSGHGALFMTTPDLLDHLRGTFHPSSETTYDDLFDRVRNTPLLVLDDLGSENATPWAMEKLYQIFNHRYTHRLPTVITTNVDLEAIDARIRSRLLDDRLTRQVSITAPDFRRGGETQDSSALSNLALYGEMTFSAWDTRADLPKPDRDNLRKAFETARRYAKSPDNWLVLTGSYGCGKTHLAAAIANEWLSQGENVMVVTVSDLLDFLRATFAPGSTATYDKRFQEMRNAPLLVLDNLGAENPSSWAREKLLQLLDHRYLAHLPTVITTNLDVEREIDPQIASRLVNPLRCAIVPIAAPSYRGKKPPSRRKSTRSKPSR